MYQDIQISKTEIGQLTGPTVIEFGANWCGYCQAAQPLITVALRDYPDIRHIKIEDGKGRRLGREYAVKLWPTLVFLKDGVEISRLVRPGSVQAITDCLHEINVG